MKNHNQGRWRFWTRLIYISVFLFIFNTLFHQASDKTRKNFEAFNVPALNHPGGDARNIQLAAHCHQDDSDYYIPNECYRAAEPIKQVHPNAIVPPFNYPSLWVDFYKIFNDSSEKLFISMWQANALALIAIIAYLALKYNALIFPVIVFNPITLLAIERGNTDAVLLMLVFAPLLLPSRIAHGFFLGLAGALKIYPLFAMAGIILASPHKKAIMAISIGLLAASPLIIQSLSELTHIHSNTPRAFDIAYGLTSFYQHPALANKGIRAPAALLLYCLIAGWCLFRMLRNRHRVLTVTHHLEQMTETDRALLLVSLAIFVFSFLTFVNFAYRFIFIIPAIFLLSRWHSRFGHFTFAALLLALTGPYFPSGWRFFNYACYVAFVPCAYILLVALMQSPPWQKLKAKRPRLLKGDEEVERT